MIEGVIHPEMGLHSGWMILLAGPTDVLCQDEDGREVLAADSAARRPTAEAEGGAGRGQAKVDDKPKKVGRNK